MGLVSPPLKNVVNILVTIKLVYLHYGIKDNPDDFTSENIKTVHSSFQFVVQHLAQLLLQHVLHPLPHASRGSMLEHIRTGLMIHLPASPCIIRLLTVAYSVGS